MPDDRYLDGDPRAEEGRGLFTDLSPFVQGTHREMKCLHDLIEAGRYEEAAALALDEWVHAAAILRRLEVPALPEVDLSHTSDASTPHRHQRAYKDRREPPPA